MKGRLISCLLIAAMLVCLPSTVFAADATSKYDPQDEARTIALNTPAVFGYASTWEVTQETVLYGASDNIVAYCFDMQNSASGSNVPKTTYAIVNADQKGFPIMLFGADGVSAYYNQSYDKAYYFGTLDFYIEVNDSVVDAVMGTPLDSNAKSAFSQVTFRENGEDYSAIRQSYLSGISLRGAPTQTGSISSGANLQWRKGCVPTSIAMLIKTKFSSLVGNTLIDSLASNMGTSSDGSTSNTSIASGINSYFSNNTNLTAPSTCAWNSKNIFGHPNTGLSNNSTSSFKTSIDAGYPVGVYCASSNVTTTGYPDGIKAHMMSGIGYSFGSNGNYVTCYTTNTADGQVSFPLTSSGLKNHAWFMLKW